MSYNNSRLSPLPSLDIDYFPCPQCSKLLSAEEFNTHLKTCETVYEENSITIHHPSYTVMSNHDDIRILCRTCGRKFLPDRIAKHQQACMNLVKKRPTFDVTKKIFPGHETDQMGIVKSKKKISFSKEFEDKMWHKQHQDFINNMRFARKLVEVEEKGISCMGLKKPVSLSEDLIECPVCHRKFSRLPAERHIPQCKNIIHKPKPPPLYREPSTKLPSLKKSKDLENSNNENSLSPNMSRHLFDPNSPSPSTLHSINRYSISDSSPKDPKLHSKCPQCLKQILTPNLALHLTSCRYITHSIKSKTCPNCDRSLLPNSKYCIMCGLKLI